LAVVFIGIEKPGFTTGLPTAMEILRLSLRHLSHSVQLIEKSIPKIAQPVHY
jgi:hypothetical protein